MESPWSTPTQSEIGEAEAALNAKEANDFIMDSDPMSHIQRELGDGEPSFDGFEGNNSNQEDDEFRAESRAVRKSKKSPRGGSKSPEKRSSRSPTKGGRKKKQSSRLDPQAALDEDD